MRMPRFTAEVSLSGWRGVFPMTAQHSTATAEQAVTLAQLWPAPWPPLPSWLVDPYGGLSLHSGPPVGHGHLVGKPTSGEAVGPTCDFDWTETDCDNGVLYCRDHYVNSETGETDDALCGRESWRQCGFCDPSGSGGPTISDVSVPGWTI